MLRSSYSFTMYHGLRFYAVRTSRDAGSRAKTTTIKIYRSDRANSPVVTLDQPAQMTEFEGLITDCGEDRVARDRIMAEFVEFGG